MMSRNYNYPPSYYPLSSRTPRTIPNEQPDILRFQHLRNLVSERNRAGADNTYHATRALETLNQEVLEHNRERARDRDRDRTNFEQARTAVDRQIQQLQSEITSPAAHIRNIWHDQLRSERSLHLPSPDSHSRRRSAPWSTLTPSPIPSRSPSLMSPPDQSGRDDQGRQKRRKLDTDDQWDGFKGFNYGLYGQVMPGELKMEIASCDGGNLGPDGVRSSPENVLHNSQSIYSTKEDRCNLVLCHRGEAPFCLKKIVIKAPQCGFDTPPQEGMVFVAMNSDELLARTAQYQIQHSNPRRRRRPRHSGLPPSQEYLSGFRPPLPHHERTVLTGPNSRSVSDTSEDPQTQFRITTEYDENHASHLHSDPEETISTLLDGTEEPTERYISDTDDDPSDDEDDMSMSQSSLLQSRRRGASGRYPDPRPRRDPSLSRSNPSAPNPSTAEVLKPHARFLLEHQNSMVTIKFDPPPSGRFILIKLWSPRRDGNIDLESIIAHGFAGPRFFPSITAR